MSSKLEKTAEERLQMYEFILAKNPSKVPVVLERGRNEARVGQIHPKVREVPNFWKVKRLAVELKKQAGTCKE